MLNLFRKKEKKFSNEDQLKKWESEGHPAPPPHIVKQRAIEEYKSKFNISVLVESGTYLGDMVEAERDKFNQIYSIELSKKLFDRAVKRFKSYQHIKIIQGDSGSILENLVPQLTQPALFWLDGHYSGGITAMGEKECPVNNELNAIFKSGFSHIILIDDARLFNGTHDYPTTEDIRDLIKNHDKKYNIELKHDIIRLTPIS